jgi:MFS family permease
MSIGWSAGATAVGWVLLRFGVQRVVMAGSAVLVLSMLGFAVLTPGMPIVAVGAIAALVGIGLGWTSSPVLVAVQTSVGYRQRGAATSLVQFARSLGGAAGVAALGSLLTTSLGSSAAQASVLLDPVARRSLDPATVAPLRSGLADGLHAVYVAMVAIAIASTLLARRLPRDLPAEAETRATALSAD